jgi:hypothetical protein
MVLGRNNEKVGLEIAYQTIYIFAILENYRQNTRLISGTIGELTDSYFRYINNLSYLFGILSLPDRDC